MMTIDHANDESGGADFDLPGFAARVLRLAYRAMKMRSERAALHAMPDYLLKDIGIGRSQIDHYTSLALSDTDNARSRS